jgi:RNA polymerase sigma factor (TIGR02999 family)
MMSEVTQIVHAMQNGAPQAADELLPHVYQELRRLAAAWLNQEPAGQTLQATALVHEAYLRLCGSQPLDSTDWRNRSYFFAAAAEAMRRILVENARHKATLKRGGNIQKEPLSDYEIVNQQQGLEQVDILALHEAMTAFEAKAPRKAELVKLRCFAGFTLNEAAEILGISPSTAEDDWNYGKAWLKRFLDK